MLEWYLLGRLGFTQRMSVALADELDIIEVTKLSQHMGNQILRGREAIVSDLDDSGLWAAEAVGFKLLLEDEDGVRRFVTDAYDRAVADGDRGMSNALFDRFHYFLNSEASVGLFGTVKQIIIDRMSELLPYRPEDTPTFGVTAARRHWHTLASAERQYGLPYRTIQKLAERAGLVEPLNTQKTRAVINAEALDDLLSGGGAQENHFNAAKRLGAHWTHFHAFEEANLLHPVSRGASKHNFTYLLRDLDRLEQAMMRYARPQSGEVEGMVSMRKAHVATDWSLAEVMKHVVAGNIPCSSVIGAKPVASIRLDLAEIRALHPFGNLETITMKEAAAIMRVSETVISRLVATKRIIGFRRRQPGGVGKQWFVSRAEVEEFHGRYIAV